MYLKSDLKHILFTKEDCPKSIGDKICKKVEAGGLKFSLEDVNSFETIEYFFQKELSENVKKLLIDKLQDICDNCDDLDASQVTTTTTSYVIGEYDIITEDGIQVITENNDPVVEEDAQITGLSVVYNANGATGTAPTDSNVYQTGDVVTIAGPGNLAVAGKTFQYWNTSSLDFNPNNRVSPGDTFTHNSNINQTIYYYAIFK